MLFDREHEALTELIGKFPNLCQNNSSIVDEIRDSCVVQKQGLKLELRLYREIGKFQLDFLLRMNWPRLKSKICSTFTVQYQ
jgi:hypothetical protein